MATKIVAASEMRKNENIQVGYGEVPAIEVEGVAGWGLPNGRVTYLKSEAEAYAKCLDKEIRARLRSPAQLLVAHGPTGITE